MLLSRFWYVALALALGLAVFLLFVAAQVYNRTGQRAMAEALSADSSAVSWYLKDDARNRSSALIPIALNPDIRNGLAKTTPEAKPNRESRDKVLAALRKLGEDVPADVKFDALWAVDANGRVIASFGNVLPPPHPEEWELGGYGVVADALHGWIRDDAWVLKGQIYRIVARPVEQEVNGEPVGAIVGAKIVDNEFAKALSKRTGAAVGFYAENARVASEVPEGFDKSRLDVIAQDLKGLENNKDYQEKGRSEVRVAGDLGLVYARMPGEAWELGAGYAVGRIASRVDSIDDFWTKADKGDQESVPALYFIGGAIVAAALGLLFSFIEHTSPLSAFKADAARLASGQIDALQPSRFRGAYKKIAADINDGIEKAAVKGGGSRRAADLEQVLGPIPAQPAMSAFAVPGPSGPGDPMNESRPSFPKAPVSQRNAPRLRQTPTPDGPTSKSMSSQALLGAPIEPSRPSVEPIELLEDVTLQQPLSAPLARPAPPKPKPPVPPQARGPMAPPQAGPSPPSRGAPFEQAPAEAWGPPAPEPPAATPAEAAWDELGDWRKVYEEFLALKRQCGEPTQNLTFEKFQGTLQRNKDALVARHNCARVKFTVYIKEGKAALKASPVK